jgi:hypothetical protein
MKVTDRDINKTLEKILNDKKEKEKEIKKWE